MDESPPTQILMDRNGDRMSKESIFEKCIPSQMNVESSDPCVKEVGVNKEKNTSIIFHSKAFRLSSFHKKNAKNLLQEDFQMERRAKKIEKIWTIRGLHVNKELLRSAASEDVFNMKALNETLPSTSEKKQGCIRFKKDPCIMEQYLERFERKRCINSSCTSQLDVTTLPNMETSNSLDDLLRKKILFFSQRKTRILAQEKHKKTTACGELKEGNEDNHNSLPEKFLSIWKGQGAISHLDYSRPVSFGSLVNYEPDNNELEKKSFGFEMNVEFPPLLIPNSDSEINYNTDLLSPSLSVPLNSPTKWKVDGSGSASSMTKLLSEIRF